MASHKKKNNYSQTTIRRLLRHRSHEIATNSLMKYKNKFCYKLLFIIQNMCQNKTCVKRSNR